MRISIAQMLGIFVLVCLAFALYVTRTQLRETQEKYSSLLALPSADHIGLVCLAAKKENIIHALRLPDYKNYQLESVFYDPNTKQTLIDHFELLYPITVISYHPCDDDIEPRIDIDNLWHAGDPSDHLIWVPANDHKSFSPITFIGEKTEKVFLAYYFFNTQADLLKADIAFRKHPVNFEELKIQSDKLKIQVLGFRLKTKNAE